MKREDKKGRGKREAAVPVKPWSIVLRGSGWAALAAVFLLGLCAVLISASVVPEGVMNACVLMCCAAGTWLGGRLAVRGGGREKLLWGLCVGGLTAALLGVSGFLLYEELEMQRCVLVGAACLCGGGAAGAMGKNTERKRRGYDTENTGCNRAGIELF